MHRCGILNCWRNDHPWRMEGERWCCDHFDEKNSISKTGMLTVIFCAILRTTTTPVRWEASGEERFVISRVAGVIEGFWWCEVKWVCLNSLSKLKTQPNQIWWIGHQNRIPCQVHKIGNKKEHAWSVMAWFHDDWMMVGNSAFFKKLLGPLTDWSMLTACLWYLVWNGCSLAARWMRRPGGSFSSLFVSVSLSVFSRSTITGLHAWRKCFFTVYFY